MITKSILQVTSNNLTYLNAPFTTLASLEIRMDTIKSFLAANELIDPTSPTYTKESQVWSAQKYLKPQLVTRPGSVESLSRLLAALNDNDLEFAIRFGGCGPVLVSLFAFDRFEFDRANEIVIIGAGQVFGRGGCVGRASH